MPILIIDNYDSFTYILATYFQKNCNDVMIVQHDQVSLSEISLIAPHAIVISPGPYGPLQAGISLAVIAHFAHAIPILGVCLGQQAIAMVFNGDICRAKKPIHGKVSQVSHEESGLFQGIPSPFSCMRYHSLAVNIASSQQLTVLARSEDNEVMALKHNQYDLYGIQFHPESILSDHGETLIKNFIATCHQQ